MTSDHLPRHEPPLPDDRRHRASPAEATVDESSRESFPASDAPSWTPTTRGPGGPARASALDPDASTTALAPWHERAVALCDAIDARERGPIARFLAEDAWLRFGDAQPVLGGVSAAAAWAQPLPAIVRVRHRVLSVRADADTVLIETEATYVTADGRSVACPEAICLHLRGARASRVQVYGPLAAAFTSPPGVR